jgi:hypothetical protein
LVVEYVSWSLKPIKHLAQKMHMQHPHYYNMAMAPTLAISKIIQSQPKHTNFVTIKLMG